MYIIGEVGSNIRNHEDALEIIVGLAKAGANAVKFQWISFEKLYGFDPLLEYHDVWDKIQEDIRKKQSKMLCNLDLEDIKTFAGYAKEAGIDFMCSVFAPEDVKKLDPLVKHHKLASCEISHRPLVQALAKSKKHVFVSTGAATDGDIEYVLDTIGRDRVTLMYCDVRYPSTRSDLTTIQYLQNVYGVPVGLSDHSLEIYNTAFAAHWFFGAVALEKHVKINNQIKSPDADHSLTLEEFSKMVQRVKKGSEYCPERPPREVLRLHKRRLIALKPIHPYDRLRLNDNCGYYRMAFDPFRYQTQMADPQYHMYAKHGEPEEYVSMKVAKPLRPVSMEKLRKS